MNLTFLQRQCSILINVFWPILMLKNLKSFKQLHNLASRMQKKVGTVQSYDIHFLKCIDSCIDHTELKKIVLALFDSIQRTPPPVTHTCLA